MVDLVLLRHGQSIWNRDNLFTGWSDVDLSVAGLEEAHTAAQLLSSHHIVPEFCFSSVLKRAIRTLWIVLDEMDLMWVPVEKDWRLNERHYGALQGMHKGRTAAQVGEDVVHTWRRSYSVRPPPVDIDDERFPGNDPRYAGIPREALPCGESLKDTVERVLPYWYQAIAPRLQQGRVVLISAHGNSLRGLVKYLDDRTDDEIVNLEIPTGVPLVYKLDANLRPIESRYLRA